MLHRIRMSVILRRVLLEVALLQLPKVLSQNGVVYGAAYKNGPKVCHIRVEKSSDLEKLKGSKYVQSDIGDSYKQVKKDLREERIVYFVGTPCQVAGLKLFLRKEYDNLLTSDLICHGTPSPEIFKNMISHVEEKWMLISLTILLEIKESVVGAVLLLLLTKCALQAR